MSAAVIRQASGWWPSLVQAECDDCGWRGPTRDMNEAVDRGMIRLDRNEHRCWERA